MLLFPCPPGLAWEICSFLLVCTETGSKGPAVNSVQFLLCVQCCVHLMSVAYWFVVNQRAFLVQAENYQISKFQSKS